MLLNADAKIVIFHEKPHAQGKKMIQQAYFVFSRHQFRLFMLSFLAFCAVTASVGYCREYNVRVRRVLCERVTGNIPRSAFIAFLCCYLSPRQFPAKSSAACYCWGLGVLCAKLQLFSLNAKKRAFITRKNLLTNPWLHVKNFILADFR